PGRLALVPSEKSSRDVMRLTAAATDNELISVGRVLTESAAPPSPTEVGTRLRHARFLVDLDILAGPELSLSPVQLLRFLARSDPLVALWRGSIIGGRVRYSELGRRDYVDESVRAVVILRPRPTTFPDEVPYSVERIPA